VVARAARPATTSGWSGWSAAPPPSQRSRAGVPPAEWTAK
jgi:hypothetical protein